MSGPTIPEGYGFSRRASSASTVVRMNSERFPTPASASMRPNTCGDRRMAVAFTPSGGRPIRASLSGVQIFSKGLYLSVIQNYISVTRNEGKTMAQFEIHPTTSRLVQAWMDRNDMASAPKPVALMRRDRSGQLQVWSWHVSELGAKRAVQNAVNNQVVR